MKYVSVKYKVILFFACFFVIDLAIAQNNETDSNKVSFGYNYNLPEWMITRSVSKVDASIFDKSVNTNFGNKLQGRVSGLTISQNNNEPGIETSTIYSRGVGTYGFKRDVLVIVDGFESTFDQLIPEEIESITLLKDAASTIMYGLKGANGVLLVTTKRGKEGPLKVSVSGQSGFESPLKIPDFLGSYDYAMLYNEGLRNDGLPNQYSESDLNSYRSGNNPYLFPDVNWYDELLRSAAPTSNVNLSFTGGMNNVRYFALLNYKSRSGIYKNTADKSEFSTNSNYTQFNVRTNIDIDLTDKLIVSLNMGFALANKANPGAHNTNSIFNKISLTPPNSFPVYNPNNTYGGNALYTNPWGDLLENGYFTSNYRTSQSAIRLTHQLDMLLSGLSVSAAASVNNTFRGYSSKSRTYDRYAIVGEEIADLEYLKFGEQSSLSSSEGNSDQWRNFSFQTSLNYNQEIGNSIVDASLGYDITDNSPLNSSTTFRHMGMNGRVSYAYNKKYIGELSLGYYGSNGYMKGKRFGLLPAVSLGWIVSNEDFLNNNEIIDFLKLRASVGISANNALGGATRFGYEQYYRGDGTYIYGTTPIGGYAESYIANKDITWEKKKEINFGFDASFIDKFNLNFDLFSQNRYDILTLPQNTIPGFAGILLLEQNVGKVNNKGFEATIGYRDNQSNDFNFFADLSIWFAKNKITYIPETIKEYEYQSRENRSIDQPFLLEDLGFFNNESEIANSPFQIFDIVQPGDIKYKDQNNDGIIDERDFYPMGYTNVPELTFGLNTGANYKNLYLNMFFQGVTNRSVYLSGSNFHAFQNDAKVTSEALNRWTPETQASALYPRLSSRNNMNNYQGSSFWQKNGSFIRIKNIEFGYTLPNILMNKIGLEGLTIYINAQNLLTFDHVKISDPEILTGYPNMRSFNIGAKFEL